MVLFVFVDRMILWADLTPVHVFTSLGTFFLRDSLAGLVLDCLTVVLSYWLTMFHDVWLTLLAGHLRTSLSLQRVTVLHWYRLTGLFR